MMYEIGNKLKKLICLLLFTFISVPLSGQIKFDRYSLYLKYGQGNYVPIQVRNLYKTNFNSVHFSIFAENKRTGMLIEYGKYQVLERGYGCCECFSEPTLSHVIHYSSSIQYFSFSVNMNYSKYFYANAGALGLDNERAFCTDGQRLLFLPKIGLHFGLISKAYISLERLNDISIIQDWIGVNSVGFNFLFNRQTINFKMGYFWNKTKWRDFIEGYLITIRGRPFRKIELISQIYFLNHIQRKSFKIGIGYTFQKSS